MARTLARGLADEITEWAGQLQWRALQQGAASMAGKNGTAGTKVGEP